MEPTVASKGHRWALVSIVAIKDTEARGKAVPMPLRCRQLDGPMGADPLCAYDALLAAGRRGRSWSRRRSGSPAAQARRPPSRTTSATSRRLAKRMAAACGMDPDEFGGKRWRIGGTTDLPDRLGDGSAAATKQQGRWHSDVAEVYQRALLDHQLDASADLANSTGVDMEAAVEGWSQPSTFRRHSASRSKRSNGGAAGRRGSGALNSYTVGNRQRYWCWPCSVRWWVVQSHAIYP
eukprot:315352-Pleurochrysis_carterae.AAC.1